MSDRDRTLHSGARTTVGAQVVEVMRAFDLGAGLEASRAYETRDAEGRRLLLWTDTREAIERAREVLDAIRRGGSSAARVGLPVPLEGAHEERDGGGARLILEGLTPRAEPFVDKQWRGLPAQSAIDAIEGLAGALGTLHERGLYLHGLRRSELYLDPLRGALFVGALPRLRERAGEPEEIWRDLRMLGELLYENLLGHDYPGGHQLAAILQERSALSESGIARAGLTQVLAGCVTPYGELAYKCVEDLVEGLEQLRAELARPLRLEVGSASSIGAYIFRRNNQDSCGHVLLQDTCGSRAESCGFFCVADGIGGIEDGERASSLAVRTGCAAFARAWSAYGPEGLGDAPVDVARAVTKVVSQTLALHGEFAPEANRGGTTFSALVIAGGRAAIGHVGDSRAMLFRKGRLLSLTRDHSLVNILIELGELDPESDHSERPDARTIARFLSTGNEIESSRIDSFCDGLEHKLHVEPGTLRRRGFDLRDGDLVLLTSDGAHEEIDDDELLELCRRLADRPQALCETIVERSSGRVARDNCTALAVRVRRGEA